MECTLAIVFGELDASCHSNKEILIQSSTVLWTTVDEGTVPILWLILCKYIIINTNDKPHLLSSPLPLDEYCPVIFNETRSQR